VQTWIGRLTKLLTRAQHVTPTSTTTVMHVLRLAASIFKRSVFGIDHKLHVTRLSVTVPPVHGDTPTPDTAANNSTASHDVSRGLSELFVQLMNVSEISSQFSRTDHVTVVLHGVPSKSVDASQNHRFQSHCKSRIAIFRR
jgi:hypothetical protein